MRHPGGPRTPSTSAALTIAATTLRTRPAKSDRIPLSSSSSTNRFKPLWRTLRICTSRMYGGTVLTSGARCDSLPDRTLNPRRPHFDSRRRRSEARVQGQPAAVVARARRPARRPLQRVPAVRPIRPNRRPRTSARVACRLRRQRHLPDTVHHGSPVENPCSTSTEPNMRLAPPSDASSATRRQRPRRGPALVQRHARVHRAVREGVHRPHANTTSRARGVSRQRPQRHQHRTSPAAPHPGLGGGPPPRQPHGRSLLTPDLNDPRRPDSRATPRTASPIASPATYAPSDNRHATDAPRPSPATVGSCRPRSPTPPPRRGDDAPTGRPRSPPPAESRCPSPPRSGARLHDEPGPRTSTSTARVSRETPAAAMPAPTPRSDERGAAIRSWNPERPVQAQQHRRQRLVHPRTRRKGVLAPARPSPSATTPTSIGTHMASDDRAVRARRPDGMRLLLRRPAWNSTCGVPPDLLDAALHPEPDSAGRPSRPAALPERHHQFAAGRCGWSRHRRPSRGRPRRSPPCRRDPAARDRPFRPPSPRCPRRTSRCFPSPCRRLPP